MKTTLAVMLLIWMMAPAARAQDNGQQPEGNAQQAQTGTQTQPSGTPPPSGSQAPPPGLQGPPGTQTETESEPAGTATDTRPLAGAEAITTTLPSAGRSYLTPSFSIWQGVDTNPRLISGQSGATGATAAAIPVGTLGLHVMGRHNSFDLGFSGGGVLYESDWSNSAAFDQLEISDMYTARRWKLFFSDRASYLPEAALGFGGIGFAGVFNNSQSLGIGGGVTQMNSFYTPEQSFLTGYAGTTSNVGMAQFQYFATPRTSVTAMGAFGYMHYSQSGLTSSNDRFGTLSIDHEFTPTQSLSFSYTVSQIHFNGGTVAFSDNMWRLGYGYRITNHFSLTLVAGPELTYSAIAGVTGESKRLGWAGQGRLGYRRERGGASISYMHYLTPGSGVFQGAETSLLSVAVNHELSRRWSGDVTAAWSRNGAFGSYSVSSANRGVGQINYEYGSVRLSRTLGHTTRFFAVYELQHQAAGAPVVAGSNSRVLNVQIVGLGFEWHPRPLGL
ncbi:MAG TPA: hypothetical protein VGZ29_05460 [Terriglobia bacterium]|nr:hypothetical protein [Terriglobia bacterium]